MSAILGDILQKLGWEDGFQIPVANFENQKLEEEMAKLSLQRIKAKTLLDSSSQRVENLQTHLKHMKQECEQTQNLITAHIQHLKSEEDLLKTHTCERDKIVQDIKMFDKKTLEVQERLASKENQLQRSAVKMETLKAAATWDKEALKAWEESLQKRNDDNDLIKKFSKEDEKKFCELEAKRQALEIEHTTRTQTVYNMVCDFNNYERILERTGQAMKQLVIERNALIQQWKDSVNILQQRDNNIDRLQVQTIELREVIDKEEEKLNEQNQFLNNEKRINNELQHETQQYNVINSRLRNDLHDAEENLHILHGQADSLRRTLLSTANHLEKQRNNTKNMEEEIMQKNKKIAVLTAKNNALNEKFNALKAGNLSSGERATHMEKLIDAEQSQEKMLENDAENMQVAYFKAQQDLQELLNHESSKKLEISGVITATRSVRKCFDEQTKTVERLKEDIYELDFKIDQIQAKILLSENIYLGQDREELENKINDLENKMSEHTEVKLMLKDQTVKIQDDMRRLTVAITGDASQLCVLKDSLQNQMKSFEGGRKQLASNKAMYHEKQVEENILRLRVEQFSKAMKKEEKHIYSLQKFKLSLEQATKERLLEIETSKQILLVKKRNLCDDRGRLRFDLSERKIRLGQFQKKYEIVLNSLGTDQDGNAISVPYFKIKNAQEKFILQREGDELDSKIRTAEKEIVAMENTLKVVNLTNVAFKQSLGAVEEDGEEMNEKNQLDAQVLEINDTMRQMRNEIVKTQQEIAKKQENCEELELSLNKNIKELKRLEHKFSDVDKQREIKEEKLRRTSSYLKIVEKKVADKKMEKYNRDLEIRQLKETNRDISKRLINMTKTYAEVFPLMNRYLSEYEIPLDKHAFSSITLASDRTSSSSPSVKSEASSSASKSTALSTVVVSLDL